MLYKAVYNRLTTYAPLLALIADRAYPVHMPQNPVYPACTYQVVSSEPRFSAFGPDKEADAKVVYKRLRITCWESTFDKLMTLKEAVRTGFQRYAGVNNGVAIKECFVDNEIELFHPELRIWQYVFDFRIAYEEA
jgi:hypothetical protein